MEQNSRPNSLLSIKHNGAEYRILIAAAILLGFGLLQSLVFANHETLTDNPLKFFETLKVFLIAVIAGVSLAFFVRALKWNWLFNAGLILLVLSCILLYHTSIHGILVGNARRWMSIWGFVFQPVELLKIAVVLSFAGVLTLGLQEKTSRLSSALYWISVLACTAVGLFLVIMQPDRSSAIMICFVVVIMAFMSRMHRGLLFSVLILGCVGIIFWFSQSDEVKKRFAGGDQYQIGLALEAIAGGGLFPTNIGESVAKYSLPAASNDFIFAIIVEQFGFFASVGLLLTYAYLFLCALKVSEHETDHYLRFMAVGATLILIANMSVHIAVNLNMTNMVTGVSLPFISKGGSGLMFNMMALGLILNVARKYDQRLKPDI